MISRQRECQLLSRMSGLKVHQKKFRGQFCDHSEQNLIQPLTLSRTDANHRLMTAIGSRPRESMALSASPSGPSFPQRQELLPQLSLSQYFRFHSHRRP